MEHRNKQLPELSNLLTALPQGSFNKESQVSPTAFIEC